MAAGSILEAISLGPGETEHYVNRHSATRHEESALKVKAACDAAVRQVLGAHATVQAAGSRAKGTGVVTSDYDLFVRRTPPINSTPVTKGQARAIAITAGSYLQEAGHANYTHRLGKVVTLVPADGSRAPETDLAFDCFKGIVRYPPDKQLRSCPGLKQVVRSFKLLAEECGLPTISKSHSLEQFVYNVCSGRQPQSITLAAALPLCLAAVAGTRGVSSAAQQHMADAGLQQQAWQNYSKHVLCRMRTSTKWGLAVA